MRPALVCLAPAVLCVACEAPQPRLDLTESLWIPPGNLQLVDGVDRLEADTHPGTGRTVVAINRGYRGGADLALLDERQQVLRVEQASRTQTVSRPVWSPAGDRFAYVEHEPPVVQGSPVGPRLQFRGRILWAGASFSRAAVAGIEDASRVLGWADSDTLVVSRFLPGDLPEERPYVVQLGQGSARPLTGFAGHMYSLEWSGDRLLFAGTSDPVVTAPAAGQTVGVFASALSGDLAWLASEQGHLPTQLRVDGDSLRYVVEGQRRAVTVELRTGRSEAAPLSEVAVPPARSVSLLDLAMPYVHQVYDTPDNFNGHWACGPTSTLMAICHFGRLDKWPETVSIPTSHTSDYGAYVSRKYTAFGTTFDTPQGDASGVTAWGAYGWCTEGGAAWAWRMQDYAKRHELSSDFDSTATLAKLKAALDAGKVVALSTQLTSAGHIITVKGYTPDDKMVVNDPYGDANAGYMNYKGEGALYTFAQVKAKWFITVYASGPQFKATIVDQYAPATMVSGETAIATVTYKNEGWATWDSSTLLGTTEARDRESPFHSADWKSKDRPAGVTAPTATGAQATLSFTLTAPTVCAPQQYTEHFNLVQEGVAWFSDSAQGGPADDAIAFAITVNPAPGACAEAGAPEAGDSGLESGHDTGAADALHDVLSDSGAKPDGGHAFTGSPSEEGCSCRAAGAKQASAAWLLVAAAIGVRRGRRRFARLHARGVCSVR